MVPYARKPPLLSSPAPAPRRSCPGLPRAMQNTVTISARGLRGVVLREVSRTGRRRLGAAPELVGRVPDLTGLARPDRDAGGRRRGWSGPLGSGWVRRHRRADVRARGRRRCRRVGRVSRRWAAERVWRWRRVGVVAGAEAVPRPGRCQWGQVAVSGHDRGRLGGRGELDLLRHRRS